MIHTEPPISVVLCADDYGLAPGVGQAIRDLIARGRLSATSCMVVADAWPAEADLIKPLKNNADIGLHLTLSDQRACLASARLAPGGRFRPLARLILGSMARSIPAAEIRSEILAQLDRFEAAMGRPPDFIDGHQHVHQLPVVRDVLLDLFETRLKGAGTFVRYCDEPLGAIVRCGVAPLRAAVISLLGRGFARSGRARGIPGNRRFRGVRSFDHDEDPARLFAEFLGAPLDGLLVMCHPGLPDAALAALDPVTEPRRAEYEFLKSGAFAALLDRAGVRLARFRDLRKT
ncbi:MAG: ChbG/HpnK family deacetylase [Alphaproteobacteria bacterium]